MAKRLLIHIREDDLSTFTKHTVKGALFHIAHLHAHEISRLKFQGAIRKNGKPARVNAAIVPGDRIEIIFPPDPMPQTPSSAAAIPASWIRYEDEDMAIVYKPAGMPVHPACGHAHDSLGTGMQAYLRLKREGGRIRLIGRLDKNVSGLVVFAKNQPAAARLWRQREQGILQKTYHALAEGRFEKLSDTLVLPLKKSTGTQTFAVGADGVQACTHYTVVRQFNTFALVRLRLETGRTHQIRAHMRSIGHPLLGDTLYGAKTALKRVGLQCTDIRCLSPFTLKRVEVKTPMDEALAEIIDTAEKETAWP